MSLPPGTRLGPYEVIAPIGAGGMGEVYRARDTRLGRDVAVKVLPAALAADPQFRDHGHGARAQSSADAARKRQTHGSTQLDRSIPKPSTDPNGGAVARGPGLGAVRADANLKSLDQTIANVKRAARTRLEIVNKNCSLAAR